MKKLIVLALLAIMLLGMVTFTACKAKEEATTDSTAVVTDEAAPAVDSMATMDSTVTVPTPEVKK